MLKKYRIYLLYFLLFFGLILLFTNGLFNNFFEQDEWGAFGDIIYFHNLNPIDFFISKGIHFTPFGFIYWFILYKIFAFNAQVYILIELLVHTFASLLVVILATRLTGNKKIGLLTGILFATNGRANQAFTHLAIFSTTISAFILIISFFIYLSYIKEKKISYKNIIILFLIFISALFFREECFIIIPLFIYYLFFFDRSKISSKNIPQFSLFAGGIILFIVFRFVSQIFNTTPIPVGSGVYKLSIIYNLVTLPFKFIVLNLVDGIRILNFFVINSQRIYNDQQINFIQNYPVFIDMAVFFIFSIIGILFSFWLYKFNNKKILIILGFSLLWILSNVLILSIVGRNLYVVERRYLYFSSFPVLMVLSMVLYYVYTSTSSKLLTSYIKKFIVICTIAILLITSYSEIQQEVAYKEKNANVRKKIISSMLENYPTIPKDTIFYINCKNKCYSNVTFGIPNEYVLPFSSGPGWIILTQYAKGNEKTWGKLLTNNFLLGLGSEGYNKEGDYGFGYFVDYNNLKSTLKEKKIPTSTVIALKYDEKNFKFIDVSKQIRNKLNEN